MGALRKSRLRWWRFAVAIVGAAGVAGLALASAHIPDGFWASNKGATRHAGLIILCVAASALAALVFYGWAPLNEASARSRRYRAAVGETLGFLVGSLSYAESQEYEDLVKQFMSTPSETLGTALTNSDPVNVIELAASFFEIGKPRVLGRERLLRVERFAIGADRRASSDRRWRRGEGLVGHVWGSGDFACQLIGGPSDPYDSTSLLRAAVAIPVLSSRGGIVGVVSVSGPPGSLPALSRRKPVLDPYRLTLANLVAEYS